MDRKPLYRVYARPATKEGRVATKTLPSGKEVWLEWATIWPGDDGKGPSLVLNPAHPKLEIKYASGDNGKLRCSHYFNCQPPRDAKADDGGSGW